MLRDTLNPYAGRAPENGDEPMASSARCGAAGYLCPDGSCVGSAAAYGACASATPLELSAGAACSVADVAGTWSDPSGPHVVVAVVAGSANKITATCAGAVCGWPSGEGTLNGHGGIYMCVLLLLVLLLLLLLIRRCRYYAHMGQNGSAPPQARTGHIGHDCASIAWNDTSRC